MTASAAFPSQQSPIRLAAPYPHLQIEVLRRPVESAVFTALLLMAANIRKIRAWRTLTGSDKATTAQRARRRRASLRDYLPDG